MVGQPLWSNMLTFLQEPVWTDTLTGEEKQSSLTSAQVRITAKWDCANFQEKTFSVQSFFGFWYSAAEGLISRQMFRGITAKLHSSSSQGTVTGSAVSVFPKNVSQMQIPRSHPRLLLHQRLWRWGPQVCVYESSNGFWKPLQGKDQPWKGSA